MPSILLAYSTVHKSTFEIAERIVEVLRSTLSKEWTVDLAQMVDIPAPGAKLSSLADHPPPHNPTSTDEKTTRLESYDAIILASPVRCGKLLHLTHKFLGRHGRTLREKPVWAFSVGMPADAAMRRREERNLLAELVQALGDGRAAAPGGKEGARAAGLGREDVGQESGNGRRDGEGAGRRGERGEFGGSVPGRGLMGHVLFDGRFERRHMGWVLDHIFRLCVPDGVVKFGDARDWDIVEAYARSLGENLLKEV